jgi:hypothetical protein
MNRDTRGEVIDEVSRWSVGGGVVTMALFPFAIPLLVLTLVFALPLLLIPLAGALVLAVVAGPFLLAWSLGRRALRALRAPRAARPAPREGMRVMMTKEN